ncbi:hypothetical protein Ahy_B08g092726 [Arachis hypogaea]|uniref:Aminotransferase-like plant mobile domain-containing protein n=1 Tax=Arachis hypogaea TaxID=3818 RepID=A0A444Y4I0_ARAHY|nr:hypothetical protein Ahy_B08g092726 [Arachis hypogaea]
MGDDPARLYWLDGVAHIAGVINDEELLGVIPPPSQVQKYAVNCSWFQETFGECPERADEETVRRYARAYIMMLLGTQLFADKSGNRIHIRWLPYVARLEEMGTYSWGSAALAWLYRCMCRVANRHVVKLAGPLQLLQSWIFWRFPRFRLGGYGTFSWPLASRWSGYNPSGSEKGPRVQMWRLRIDRLQDREFIWMPYSSPDILQVVHPEALEPRHMALWRSVTSLIYFAVIEWHQIDRVLPQFGGTWHLHWESRAETVLRFDVVADPGPSHEFLEWWSQHGKRFLSPEMSLGDPRAVLIPIEASQRGAGRVPDMDRVEDMPDRRRVERRARVGTRRSQRAVAVAGVSGHDGGHGGEWYGSGMGDGADHGDPGLGSGPLGDYFAPLDVDLNEPPTTSVADHFALGGTPPSAYAAALDSVAGPSAAPVHSTPPAQPAPDEEEDEIEDEEPLIRRGHRTRVPRRCFTGSHLFR